MKMHKSWLLAAALLGGAALATSPAAAQKKYDTGASDTEIKVGNTNPYSGPASAYGVIGKTIAAYFNKINAEGGVNGRKINFVSYDDGYTPPKTVEQVRKLVESDEVLLLFQTLGTPPNTAIQKYLNAKKVPQLFVATGATKWNDPKNHPWTIGWQPNYQSEGHIYAQYLLNNVSNSVGAVLKPAGLDNSKGIFSTQYLKDPTDPAWKEDPAYKEWTAFMDKYYPEGDRTSTFTVYGYLAAQTFVQTIKQCGDDLTRENVMKQAANLKDLQLGMLLPGITINTSATDFAPIKQMQMERFTGEKWELFGPVLTGQGGAS